MGINGKAFHQLSYGLYLLSARQGEKDNACIVDAVAQVASDPKTIALSSATGGCTQQMIDATGAFNLSVLPEGLPMEFYRHFGMQSGFDVDKFADDSPFADPARLENGIVYAPEANAVISCTVKQRLDLGDHILYIAEATYAEVLSSTPSITYAAYRAAKAAGLPTAGTAEILSEGTDTMTEANTPETVAAEPEATGSTTWVCQICGYVHEGPEPPESCPICGVGPELFEQE